jgi:hypothetical protein
MHARSAKLYRRYPAIAGAPYFRAEPAHHEGCRVQLFSAKSSKCKQDIFMGLMSFTETASFLINRSRRLNL